MLLQEGRSHRGRGNLEQGSCLGKGGGGGGKGIAVRISLRIEGKLCLLIKQPATGPWGAMDQVHHGGWGV